MIPPTGGTARGQLRVDSPAPLPSGTLVQAEIAETFTLPSDQVASEEQRRQDIVLYRAPTRAIAAGCGDPGTPAPDPASAVSAALPITPSRTFDPVANSSKATCISTSWPAVNPCAARRAAARP